MRVKLGDLQICWWKTLFKNELYMCSCIQAYIPPMDMKSKAELTPAERLLNRCSLCLMPPMIMQIPCAGLYKHKQTVRIMMLHVNPYVHASYSPV